VGPCHVRRFEPCPLSGILHSNRSTEDRCTIPCERGWEGSMHAPPHPWVCKWDCVYVRSRRPLDSFIESNDVGDPSLDLHTLGGPSPDLHIEGPSPDLLH